MLLRLWLCIRRIDMFVKRRARSRTWFLYKKCSECLTKTCVCTFLLYVVKTLALVGIYFVFSIGLTFYQKWFIKKFRFPLSIVICHLVIKFLLAQLIRSILSLCYKRDNVHLTWSVYIKNLFPPGVTSALDIGFSNWSFEYITISLYTMTKSSCIVFILIFSLVFGLERLQYSLVLIVSLISSGLFMFTYHATQFSTEGFILVISASVMGGLRWTLTQVVTQKDELGLSNPLDMIYHVQPWMIVTLLPLAVALEGKDVVTSKAYFRDENISTGLQNGSLVLVGSILAFLMEFSEFLLIAKTSSLTLNIAGIFKEIISLFLAHQYNGDQMNIVNFIGLIVCLTGIIIHMSIKINHASQGKLFEREKSTIDLPLLSKGKGPMSDDDDEEIVYEKNCS